MEMTMPEKWQEQCAARMTRFLSRPPRSTKTYRYLKTLPQRERLEVKPEDFPLVSRAEARLNEVARLVRDAQRYADWERRGKPSSPSKPRKDRLRPSARRGSDPHRNRLYEAQSGNCGLCRNPLSSATEGTFDHVVPRALGGRNAGNLLLAHERCNNEKADRPPTQEELEMLAAVNAIIAQTKDGQDVPNFGQDNTASVDTHAKRGDVKQAPSPMGSAVPPQAGDAQPSQDSQP